MGCMDNYSGLGLNPPLNPIYGAVGNKKSRPRQTMAKLHLSPQLPLLVDNTRFYRRQGSLKLNNPLVQQQKRLAIPRPLLQLLVRHLAFSGSRWSCAAQLHCSWLPSCTAALHCHPRWRRSSRGGHSCPRSSGPPSSTRSNPTTPANSDGMSPKGDQEDRVNRSRASHRIASWETEMEACALMHII